MENKRELGKRFSLVFAAAIGLLQLQSYYVESLGCKLPVDLYQWIGLFSYFVNWFIPVWIGIRIITVEHKVSYSETLSVKHCIIITGVFFLSRLMYLYVYYPGTFTGDTSTQLCMFYHLPTMAAGRIATNGADIFYNAHYSLLFTFIYGLFYRFGELVGNLYIGIFLFSVVQIAISSFVFSYAIREISKVGISRIALIWCVVWIAVMPNIGLFTITMIADVQFAIEFIIITIMLFKVGITKGEILKNRKYTITLFAVLLLFCMTKKTGVYISAISLFALMLIYRKAFKRVLCVFVCLMVAFCILYEGVFYAALNVKKSGTQEALSLPFQQVARYLKGYSDEINADEEATIQRVLDKDRIIQNYNPDLSDPVKDTFKENASFSDLKDFLKVWLKFFVRHPKAYFDAFIAGTYRYTSLKPMSMYNGTWGFYGITSIKYVLSYTGVFSNFNVSEEAVDDISVQSPDSKTTLRNKWREAIMDISGQSNLGVLFSIGFYFCFIMVFAGYCALKDRRKVIAFLPSFLIIVTCMLSPVNGSDRYSLPVIFAFPLLLAISFSKGQAPHEKSGTGLLE